MLLGSLLYVPNIIRATDYTSANFILRDPVITVEGGQTTSASFKLISSTGQTIIGENTSSNFIHRAGFLYFPAAVSAVPEALPGIGSARTRLAAPLPQVNFFGQAEPSSTIFLLKDARISATTTASADGSFFLQLTGLSAGRYIFSLYAESEEGKRSNLLMFPVEVFSNSIINITDIFFGPVIRRDLIETACADPNKDGRVDLIDFSILIFWFEKDNVPPHIDCNADGIADLIDFSIMAYYWTG